SIKHFAANNAETNRNALDTVVSERALRELYLEGFRIAVEGAQPWTVMSAYNLINGTHTSESHDLLTKVLRDDWGFRGFVMTDWFGGIDPVAQVEAGNDLLMPGTIDQAKAIISAVEEGRLDERVLDRNIERILQVLVRSPRFRGYAYSNEPDLKAHAEVARQAASEGMVLLKNSDRTLPLAPAARLALFGNASYATVIGGTGSGKVNEAYSVSPAEGLTAAGYAVDESLRGSYRGHIEAEKSKLPPPRPFAPQVVIEEMAVGPAPAARAAASADAAIITIGRNSGEGRDRNIDGDFNLTRAEKELIEQVARAFHAGGKKVVVVLNIGGVIETASWRDIPDAMLLVWQGGQEAGNAIADVLSGRVNPSGKLATTFPVSYPDVPSAKNFPGTVIETAREPNGDEAADQEDLMAVFRKPKASRVVYEEGIYVGYRYHETFGVKPAYEFGYGLSYTNFDYSGLRLSSGQFSESLTVAVVVRNTGDRAGREVAQLYIGAPAVKLDKPAAELKGFAKTRLLQPGESELLEFTLLPRDLSSFDAALSSWIAEAGDYEIRIGASSRDIRRTAVFSLKRELMVKKDSVALRPVRPINEMKP
ncbi:MAG TPA: glycoside hydrolase family 3 C-terminal domain-containing protein, partial [Acidobacteriota bacterium]|nr:glycoside hydrolase family 3 C-terminal domain-containing protein [Acidobacteriota bacterium]